MADKKRVLLVDDEASFTNLTSMVLEDSGKYEVKAVNQGSPVPSMVASFKPDLIVLDVIMPDISGIEVAKRLRSANDAGHIPIIFLTASISRENPSHWNSGVDGISYKIENEMLLSNPVLAKPVSSEELMTKIDQILAQTSTA